MLTRSIDQIDAQTINLNTIRPAPRISREEKLLLSGPILTKFPPYEMSASKTALERRGTMR
jgi:hypothetical protein